MVTARSIAPAPKVMDWAIKSLPGTVAISSSAKRCDDQLAEHCRARRECQSLLGCGCVDPRMDRADRYTDIHREQIGLASALVIPEVLPLAHAESYRLGKRNEVPHRRGKVPVAAGCNAIGDPVGSGDHQTLLISAMHTRFASRVSGGVRVVAIDASVPIRRTGGDPLCR